MDRNRKSTKKRHENGIIRRHEIGEPVPPGYKLIFRRYITLKDGRRIYPRRAKVFAFLVPIEG